MMLYTLPSIMDDLTIKASYSPGGAGGGSATAWHLNYAGVEGLTLDYAEGETETIGSEADLSIAYGQKQSTLKVHRLMKKTRKINVSYTTGGVTLTASSVYFDNGGNSNTEAAATGDSERWALSATLHSNKFRLKIIKRAPS